MLGKLPVPRRPAGLTSGGARAYCTCEGCGWGLFLDVFAPVCHFSFFSFSGRRPDIDCNNFSRAVRPKTTIAFLAKFLTTQYAMLEYVKQKLHGVRENKAIMFAYKNQSK